MNLNQLDANLENALQGFRDNVDAVFPKSGSSHPVDSEIHDLAYQVNGALLEFKENIISYLKEKES